MHSISNSYGFLRFSLIYVIDRVEAARLIDKATRENFFSTFIHLLVPSLFSHMGLTSPFSLRFQVLDSNILKFLNLVCIRFYTNKTLVSSICEWSPKISSRSGKKFQLKLLEWGSSRRFFYTF